MKTLTLELTTVEVYFRGKPHMKSAAPAFDATMAQDAYAGAMRRVDRLKTELHASKESELDLARIAKQWRERAQTAEAKLVDFEKRLTDRPPADVRMKLRATETQAQLLKGAVDILCEERDTFRERNEMLTRELDRLRKEDGELQSQLKAREEEIGRLMYPPSRRIP